MLDGTDGVFHQWFQGSTFAVNSDVVRETHR